MRKLPAPRRLFLPSSQRTVQFENAVTALRRLMEENGGDHATAAYAEATSEYIRLLYAKTFGLRRSSGRNALGRLLGQKYPGFSRHGWEDHTSLWLKKGKPYIFVSQPYHLSLGQVRHLVQYCDAHNLDLHICAGWSWHYPGTTLFIELRRDPERRERFD